MLGKLAVALRSIASALEEIEENKGKAGWEVVEEVVRSNPKSLLLPVNLVAQTWPITRTFGTTLYWVGAGSRSFEAFGVVKLQLHGGPWRAN